MSLESQLAEAEALAEHLRREIAQGPCRNYGHDWQFSGGANAGCDSRNGDNCCACSVPVHTCTKCGDCDYGDNAEADEVRCDCLRLNPRP